jgi:glycosyltransferase involved in cell wall biosynthesis
VREPTLSQTPLVTVVIPTYNRAGVICRTIDNVLGQSWPNIEIIVVDDGSTDDTQARLSPYLGRIRVIAQSNAGPAAARNRGIEAAQGKFIALQDSDDLWVPTKLERQIALLNKADKSVVCCVCDTVLRYTDRPEVTDFQRAWLFPPYEQGIWTNVAEVLATRFVFFCQTAVIQREALERIGGFNETLKYHEDYELPLRLALEGPWAFIRDQLTIWNQSAESWSQKALSEEIHMRECEVRMRESILSRIGDSEDSARLRRLLRRELGRNHRELWLAKLPQAGFPGALLLASFLRRLQRYSWGIYRRTPWYPKFEGEEVETELGVF